MDEGLLLRLVRLLIFGAAIALSACRAAEPQETIVAGSLPDTPYVKIWVLKAGTVELDGKAAELAVVCGVRPRTRKSEFHFGEFVEPTP